MTRPYPERITQALDAPAAPGAVGPLEGPDVDEFCDAAEPAVDRWETGEEIPTLHQLELLAELTGYPLGFFFTEPVTLDGPGFLCVRSGRGKGCYPLTGDLSPEQERALTRALTPPRTASSPVPKPDMPPPGVLPECSGPCGRPMRRDAWVAQSGRCSSCGPARGNPDA